MPVEKKNGLPNSLRFPGSMFDLASYLRTGPSIALVGATNDTTKYGNIILRDLVSKGYTVIPANPRAKSVEGIPACADLREAREKGAALVVYVIPPKLTLESLAQARELGMKKVWVQPGAGDEAVREYLDANSFEYLMDACVMVETRVA